MEKLFGVGAGDRFYNQLTMHFSPIYHIYEIHWVNSKTGNPRDERLLSVCAEIREPTRSGDLVAQCRGYPQYARVNPPQPGGGF
jgi:hypothetical protein